jgi:tetratricopeptide (TPR) repeat protein
LADQGHASEAIADHGRAIEIYEELIEREARRELRDHLAKCYTNRGLALADQGYSSKAIDDFGRGIEITKELIERERRPELHNDLAKHYNNRGIALANQARLPEAIADFTRAIEIREELVEREERRELRSDLESSLFNRALAGSKTGRWKQASVDIEKGVALLQTLVEEGQRQVLSELLKTVGFRCQYVKELGNLVKAVEGANEAMQWFLEEVEQGNTTEPLRKAATGFANHIRGNQELLLQHGLDETLWQRFQASLGPTGGGSPPA